MSEPAYIIQRNPAYYWEVLTPDSKLVMAGFFTLSEAERWVRDQYERAHRDDPILVDEKGEQL